MSPHHKRLAWLHGTVTTPPFSIAARTEAGFLLRLLQRGDKLSLPHSRPMPALGPRCHELRINDESKTWRVLYRLDPGIVIIVEVFEKKTQQTPDSILRTCKQRLKDYDATL